MFGPVQFQIGTTPNPNALRVALTQVVFEKPTTYATAAAAEADPLAQRIFALGGVKQVFCFNDFITVTKEPGADWSALQPKLADVLAGHFHA